MFIFILLTILVLGIWTGLNFLAESNGFLPALAVPVVIALVIDAILWGVFVKWLQWASL